MSAPAYPRVSPCRHCGLAVLRDNDGAWIHANLSYLCRDRGGELRGSRAAPELPPRRDDWGDSLRSAGHRHAGTASTTSTTFPL